MKVQINDEKAKFQAENIAQHSPNTGPSQVFVFLLLVAGNFFKEIHYGELLSGFDARLLQNPEQ